MEYFFTPLIILPLCIYLLLVISFSTVINFSIVDSLVEMDQLEMIQSGGGRIILIIKYVDGKKGFGYC